MPTRKKAAPAAPENRSKGGKPTEDQPVKPVQGAAVAGKMPYRDDPHVTETFADNCHLMSFDGAVLRMEFTVRRIDQSTPDGPRAYNQTAERLVIPRQAIVDLHNQLGRVVEAMSKKAAVEPKPPQKPDAAIRLPEGKLPN